MKTAIANLFNHFTGWIHEVLDENSSQSSTRLILLSAWGSVLSVWVSLSLVERRMVEIPGSVLAMLGMATGAKVTQNAIEAKSAPQA
jgi:hypothetical protein